MDMDDPWGSPWADELNNEDSLGTRRIEDLADGNQIGKASEALRNTVNTTWSTSDHGFGDWEEDTGEKKGGQHGLGLDGAAEQWDTPERGRELEVIKDNVRTLSPGWNDISTSPAREVPKLSPSLLAKPAAAIAREPSPDPWANAVASDESATMEDNAGSEVTISSPEIIGKATDDVDVTQEDFLDAVEAIVPQAESSSETKVEPEESVLDKTAPEVISGLDNVNEEPESIELSLEGVSEGDLCTEGAEKEHHKIDDAVLPSTEEPEHESSRPSSSPSDTSHHDELLLDSPRTSLDEEPKRSRITRAASPRAQEAVEGFDGSTELEDLHAVGDVEVEEKVDGSKETEDEHAVEHAVEDVEVDEKVDGSKEPEDELAVEDVEVEEKVSGLTEPEDEHATTTKHENPKDGKVEEEFNAKAPDDDDDFGDFGDFEEGMSDDGEELVENHDAVKPPISSDLAMPQNEPAATQLPKRPSGPVDFSIDLASVKTLFGEIKEDDEAVEKIFIPDTIIADTFSSTEERKMWYRVSRYGTMRKYNTGGDENYVRISWTQSQVKQDTQKIVARWMEEDQNNGHLSLGGTSKGGSLFGWNDPNAPPVPLATVLGSKRKSAKLEAKLAARESVEVPREWPKKLARDRSRSKSRSSSKPREHSSTKSAESCTNVKIPPLPSVGQFGWPSTPAMQIASGSDSLASHTRSSTKPLPLQMNSAVGHSRQSSSVLQSALPMSPIEPPPRYIQAVPKPRPISMPPPFTSSSNISIANSAAVPNGLNEDDDDDDEWGEMVSSPVVTEAPNFPTRGLRHRKSMSLGNSLTNSIPLPNPQVTKLQSGFGHRSTSSLDNTPGTPECNIFPQHPVLSGTTIPSPMSSNMSFADLWSTPASTPVPIQSPRLPPSPALSATAIANTSSQHAYSPSNTTFQNTWSQPHPNASSVLTSPPTSAWSQPPNSSTSPASVSNTQDPWASVDFSFFDAPAPAPAPVSLSRQTANSRPLSYPAALKPKTVTFSTPSPKSIPSPPASSYTSHNSKPKFEMEQDEIVKRIVGGLPDLGYMFRR